MTDFNHHGTKLIIAAGIYLMVAIMVAAGLGLKGSHAAARKGSAVPTQQQQSALVEAPAEAAGKVSAQASWSAEETSFSAIDATLLIAPAMQRIIASKPRVIF